MNVEGVMLAENETKLGSVETYAHSKACAELFKANRERIEGILVVLPNFGDEKGVADTIKLSGLNVPILVQAYPDDLNVFCGKISICNNLRQYGYEFNLTSLHTCRPTSELFKKDHAKFLGDSTHLSDDSPRVKSMPMPNMIRSLHLSSSVWLSWVLLSMIG